MSEVRVFTPGGKMVGKFVDPVTVMDPACCYEIKGMFILEDGLSTTPDRIEFNPQVLPYSIDISQVSKCKHKTLNTGYVQRGRQPVAITGYCDTAASDR